MPPQHWPLVDIDQNLFCENLALNDLGGCSARVFSFRGGLGEGLQGVELNNGTCRFVVLPGRGMGIWKGWYRAADGEEPIGWQSPLRGPIHPQYVPISEPSGLGWLAGFDELFVRCGLESNGAPEFDPQGKLLYPVHGRIANLPAQRVTLTADREAGELHLTGEVDESRFHFRKFRLTTTISTRRGERGFRVTDTVTNLSGERAEAQMLYHINFGPPACLPGSRLVLPVEEMSPRDATAAARIEQWDTFGPEESHSAEQVYFFRLLSDSEGRTEALMHNAQADRGASVRFQTATLPCFTVWKNTPLAADGYCTGLEPGTNFPNPRTHEGGQGRVVPLDAGGSVTFQVGVEYHADAEQVAAARESVARLQQGREPRIHANPKPGWTV